MIFVGISDGMSYVTYISIKLFKRKNRRFFINSKITAQHWRVREYLFENIQLIPNLDGWDYPASNLDGCNWRKFEKVENQKVRSHNLSGPQNPRAHRDPGNGFEISKVVVVVSPGTISWTISVEGFCCCVFSPPPSGLVACVWVRLFGFRSCSLSSFRIQQFHFLMLSTIFQQFWTLLLLLLLLSLFLLLMGIQ